MSGAKPSVPAAALPDPAGARRGAAGLCPLCGQANRCAVVQAGHFDVDCWCRHVSVNPAALARLPATGADLACLCPRCATGQPGALSDSPAS